MLALNNADRMRAQRIARRAGRGLVAELHELYVEQRQSLATLATRYSVSKMTVRRWLLSCDIQLRPRGGPNRRKTG